MDPFERGKEAYRRGLCAADNPFKPLTHDRRRWTDGWLAASIAKGHADARDQSQE